MTTYQSKNTLNWQPVPKPAELAEHRLLEGILTGHFPINSNLPAERDLSDQINVTRPTLRVALQRLARDGWLEIQQGKPTRVRDYWREGSLAVLSVLAQNPANQSSDFIAHLLEIRILLAPAYVRQAIQTSSTGIANLLEGYRSLEDSPAAFTHADWELHRLMTQSATNPVFQLLLNGFRNLYLLAGEQYFNSVECRQHSRGYYRSLLDCALRKADEEAEALTRRIMIESLEFAKKMKMGISGA
jgi:GntR family transcriptional regulator, negative regulator for fad regulon and positive regulator of fabA